MMTRKKNFGDLPAAVNFRSGILGKFLDPGFRKRFDLGGFFFTQNFGD